MVRTSGWLLLWRGHGVLVLLPDINRLAFWELVFIHWSNSINLYRDLFFIRSWSKVLTCWRSFILPCRKLLPNLPMFLNFWHGTSWTFWVELCSQQLLGLSWFQCTWKVSNTKSSFLSLLWRVTYFLSRQLSFTSRYSWLTWQPWTVLFPWFRVYLFLLVPMNSFRWFR